MGIHLQRKLQTIRTMVATLAGEVEQAVDNAVRAIETRDADLAADVIVDDDKIDRMEIDLEEECLKALALEGPVAHDLRYVVAILKVNNDLERIADMAANLARQANYLAHEEPVSVWPIIQSMTELVKHMLREALESLLAIDPVKAERVRAADDRVDDMHRQMYEEVEAMIRAEPAAVSQLLHVLNISKNLERIGDLATNIAEDVVYMVHGDIVRHSARA
jgi:phosphate transport system protein